MKNNKGASVGVVLMFALLLFFFGIALASPMNTAVQTVRTNLNCSGNFTNLDYGNKGVCAMSDLYSPLFIAILLGLGGTLIGIKLTS